MFYFIKTASKLYLMSSAGVAVELTVPIDTTVIAGRRMRSAILNGQLLGVNGTNQPVWVDPNNAAAIARNLSIARPAFAPTVAAGAAGTLSGTFNIKIAFLVKDSSGDVLAHGPYSDASDDVTLTNQNLRASNIATSPHPAVNCRRIARTTTGPGSVYFEFIDLDDNVSTAIEDDLADEALSLFPIPDDLGEPPSDLEMIVEWKNRLWGKTRNAPDSLYFSGDGAFYAWPDTNEILIPPFKQDTTGINGFIRRRDELGIGRLDRWWKIIGDDPANFARVVLIEGTGIVAPDSTVTIKDVGYWLAHDGVYSWGPDGVKNISQERVHGWFTKDDTFNRSEFDQAVGWWDPRFHTYNLMLCAAGSTTLDRWVTYDIEKRRWFGPHKTGAFTLSFAALMQDADANYMPVLCGSDGFVRKMNQASSSNDDATAIDFDVYLRHNCKTPDISKVFMQMSMLSRVESGGTLTITPHLGDVGASAQATIAHDLTTGRQRLRHISTIAQAVGRILKLRLQNAEAGKPVHVYGYEIPFHESGRR